MRMADSEENSPNHKISIADLGFFFFCSESGHFRVEIGYGIGFETGYEIGYDEMGFQIRYDIGYGIGYEMFPVTCCPQIEFA